MTAWTIPSYAEWAVPGYTEERPLGHGVSGRVVAALNDHTGQRVAIKYLDPDLIRDPEFLAGLRSAAGPLSRLDAPHVARVFDYVEEPGQGAAIVTELVNGVSLREMIARRGPLSPAAALVVLKDALIGLAAAHSRRVPHRDVKPDNVLVDAGGWCTLTDFGVAVKADRQLTGAGTPPYMAPELWNGAPSVPATDIYAVTAVFCESLAGQPPFSGRLGQLRREHETAPPPLADFDPPLRDLIAWGLAKYPADRPRSARSFLSELDGRAEAAYGPRWEDQGRGELAERATALLPLRAGGGGGSVTVTRLARRKVLMFVAGAAVALVALVVVAAAALSGKSANVGLSSAFGGIVSAQVTVTPPVAAGNCTKPTSFSYQGTVSATEAGTLTYQWVYSTGKTGPVQTLRFTAAGDQTVTGGSVRASKEGSGWAEIKVLTPVQQTSSKATYQLLCGATSSDVALSASVQPASQTVSSCAQTPPNLTATGSITSKKAGPVSYYWALADGRRSTTGTVDFTAPGTKAVSTLTFAPEGLPVSGEAVLVVSKPVYATSRLVPFSVSCPTTPAAATTAPTTLKSSAGASKSASRAARSSAPAATAGTSAPVTPTSSAPVPPTSSAPATPTTSAPVPPTSSAPVPPTTSAPATTSGTATSSASASS